MGAGQEAMPGSDLDVILKGYEPKPGNTATPLLQAGTAWPALPLQASAPTPCPGWLGVRTHLCDALCNRPAGALLEGAQARLLPLLQRGVQRLQLALVPAVQSIAYLSGGHSARPGTGFLRRLTDVSGEEALVWRQRKYQVEKKAPGHREVPGREETL